MLKGLDLVKHRRSVRTFNKTPLSREDASAILEYAEKTENPYRLPITWKLLSAKSDHLSVPVIDGTDMYLAGKMKKAPCAEMAFGYAMEDVVLHAESLGLGTTWIAGTMDRAAFEEAMELQDGEVLPCITPLGYPASKMSVREKLMRAGISADSRLPFENIFFSGDFSVPLSRNASGDLADILEMVRLAPSAVNRQPWRLVVDGSRVHFYMQKGKVRLTDSDWDLQKIDLGIAMYHFSYGLEQAGMRADFRTEDPGIDLPARTFYISTCIIR